MLVAARCPRHLVSSPTRAGDGKGFEKLLSAAAQGDGAGGNMQELLAQARYRRDTAEIPPRYLPMHWLRLNDD